jgi:hypothetical protein
MTTIATTKTRAHSLVILSNVPASDLAAKHQAIETLFDQEYSVFVAGEFRDEYDNIIFLGNTHPQGIQKTRELNVFALRFSTESTEWFGVKRENSDGRFEPFRPENGVFKHVRFVLKSLKQTED